MLRVFPRALGDIHNAALDLTNDLVAAGLDVDDGAKFYEAICTAIRRLERKLKEQGLCQKGD